MTEECVSIPKAKIQRIMECLDRITAILRGKKDEP
jgi:hypothetical protein